MAYISPVDYISGLQMTPAITGGSVTDIENIRTNKLTETSRMTLSGASSTCTMWFDTGALGETGCLMIGGLDTLALSEITVRLKNSSGTTTYTTKTLNMSSEVLSFVSWLPNSRNVYFWFDEPFSFGRVEIEFKGSFGSPVVDVGRIWLGPKFECEFDGGYSNKVVSNTAVGVTVGGQADIVVKAAYNEIKLKTSGEHMGSSIEDIFRLSPTFLLNDLKWSDIDYLVSLYQECVVSWRNTDATGNHDQSPSFFASDGFSSYARLKTSSGIKHITGSNYELTWTLLDHL